MVFLGRIAAERELEAPLARESAVAGPRVAPEPRQHRDDMALEVPRERFLRSANDHVGGRASVRRDGGQRRLAVAYRPGHARRVDGDDPGIRGGELGLGGHLTGRLSALASEYEKTLTRLRAAERDTSRLETHVCARARCGQQSC